MMNAIYLHDGEAQPNYDVVHLNDKQVQGTECQRQGSVAEVRGSEPLSAEERHWDTLGRSKVQGISATSSRHACIDEGSGLKGNKNKHNILVELPLGSCGEDSCPESSSSTCYKHCDLEMITTREFFVHIFWR